MANLNITQMYKYTKKQYQIIRLFTIVLVSTLSEEVKLQISQTSSALRKQLRFLSCLFVCSTNNRKDQRRKDSPGYFK